MRRRSVRFVSVTIAALAFAIQFVRPARTNPPTDPSATLHAQLAVPPAVASILDRSCRDCHSNETRWPWYSNVAPVSWWVIDHVNHGRSHFNFSRWAKYNSEEQRTLLTRSCELSQGGAMPLPSYLRMHDAAMSAADVASLCAFTESATRRDTHGLPSARTKARSHEGTKN